MGVSCARDAIFLFGPRLWEAVEIQMGAGKGVTQVSRADSSRLHPGILGKKGGHRPAPMSNFNDFIGFPRLPFHGSLSSSKRPSSTEGPVLRQKTRPQLRARPQPQGPVLNPSGLSSAKGPVLKQGACPQAKSLSSSQGAVLNQQARPQAKSPSSIQGPVLNQGARPQPKSPVLNPGALSSSSPQARCRAQPRDAPCSAQLPRLSP